MNAIVSALHSRHTRGRWQPVVSAETLILLVAMFIAIADNRPFWRAVLLDRDHGDASTWKLGLLTLTLLTAVNYIVLALISTRRTVKPVLCASMLIGALVTHYISRYGIVIDTSMMRNVLHTDAHEVVELVGIDLLTTLLPWAALPIGLVALTPIATPRRAAVAFREPRLQ